MSIPDIYLISTVKRAFYGLNFSNHSISKQTNLCIMGTENVNVNKKPMVNIALQ